MDKDKANKLIASQARAQRIFNKFLEARTLLLLSMKDNTWTKELSEAYIESLQEYMKADNEVFIAWSHLIANDR